MITAFITLPLSNLPSLCHMEILASATPHRTKCHLCHSLDDPMPDVTSSAQPPHHNGWSRSLSSHLKLPLQVALCILFLPALPDPFHLLYVLTRFSEDCPAPSHADSSSRAWFYLKTSPPTPSVHVIWARLALPLAPCDAGFANLPRCQVTEMSLGVDSWSQETHLSGFHSVTRLKTTCLCTSKPNKDYLRRWHYARSHR